jgi:hypothetical protein
VANNRQSLPSKPIKFANTQKLQSIPYDMAGRARISAWRPLMAQGAGLLAGRVAARLDEKRAVLASLGERPVAAALDGRPVAPTALDEKRAVLASLGGRPVAPTALDEKRAALASLGGQPVAPTALDEKRAVLASLGGRPVAGAGLDAVLPSPV